MTSLVALSLMALLQQAAPCESLRALNLPNTTITSAELVAAGPFTPPAPAGPPGGPVAPAGAGAQAGGRGGAGRGGGGGAPAAPAIRLPAHCRVAAVLKPSSDSHIEMEVWMPAENWNGKFQAVGNGGWAGSISFPAMATALQEGYATASNDTGHKGGSAVFAVDHPEKLVDFAYRAVHEMTVQSKAIIAKYYNRPARLSYWNGCSTGGRQGLMAAQKYPEDFDAIVAGAPANYHTHLHTWDLSIAVPIAKNPAAAVPAPKLQLVNAAVINACDGLDGVKDGLLNDPRACRFDVAALQCRAGDAEDCLTAAQVETVKRIYAPAKTSAGDIVFPGKAPGSEPGWTANQAVSALPSGSFVVAYNNAKWDALAFDLDRDLKIVDEKVGSVVNAVNPDLRAFKARGGKLLLYHGWNDTAISPGNAVDYYTSVLKKMGGRQDDFVRLYMAPGMNHCGGGAGPNQVNWMAALERWRESGDEPDRIEAYRVTNNRVDMTRPLCPYPQVAQYKGTGSTNDANNFVCKAP
jgi:feruloyl esterase